MQVSCNICHIWPSDWWLNRQNAMILWLVDIDAPTEYPNIVCVTWLLCHLDTHMPLYICINYLSICTCLHEDMTRFSERTGLLLGDCTIGQIAVNHWQHCQTKCWSHVTYAMHRLHIDKCMCKIAKHLHLFWCQDMDGFTLDSNALIVHFSSELLTALSNLAQITCN